jgi:hypothetical protein
VWQKTLERKNIKTIGRNQKKVHAKKKLKGSAKATSKPIIKKWT